MVQPQSITRGKLVAYLAISTLAVTLLATLWKFGIEEWADPFLPGDHADDSTAERWEFVISAALFSLAAMLLPSVRAVRQFNRHLQENRLAATVFSGVPQALVVCDARRVVTKVNPAFTEITGWREQEIVGQPIGILRSDLQDDAFYQEIKAALDADGGWSGELWNRRHGDGAPYAVWLSITSVGDSTGPRELVGVLSDITWRKQREETAMHQANHDPLTGLANRRHWCERLRHAIHNAELSGEWLAVMFIDLDGFKQVNDSLGHAAGDQLLMEVARRLSACARAGDLLGRLGGDEFLIILHQLGSAEAAELIAQRCLGRLAAPYSLCGSDVRISGSIGIAMFPEHAKDADQLLAEADAAMYRAKRNGKNSIALADSRPTVDARPGEPSLAR